MRQTASSGSPLEPAIGFSRAVRVGRYVAIAGTAPIGPDGSTIAPGDVARQTRRCLDVAAQALTDVGGSLHDVTRTRVLLTDIRRWHEAAEVHGQYFSEIRPACTFVQVSGFIDPGWLVEIEMDAVLEPDRNGLPI